MHEDAEPADGMEAPARAVPDGVTRLLTFAPPVAVAVGVVTALWAVPFWLVYRTADIPPPEELARPEPTVLVDVDGERFDTLEPASLHRNVDLASLPDHLVHAVLAAEDRSFHDHHGFSLRAMGRAALANLRAGGVQEGASTITQQYVALAVTDVPDSYVGKFQEAALAARLEEELPKDRILEMYLNAVPWGRTATGIEAAARTYFGVPAEELDVHQSAVLAGMIAAPSAFDPYRDPDAARVRRDRVLRAMRDTGVLDAETAGRLRTAELPPLREAPLVDGGPQGYVRDLVAATLPELLDDPRVDPTEDLVVHTTIDPDAQELAADALRAQVEDHDHTGAVVTIAHGSGAVRALVGGPDHAAQPFNTAVQSDRQIGSTFKTFTLTLLARGGYDPDQVLIHAPRVHEFPGEEDATVGNYSGHGHGVVTAREATVESINTAYVRLAEQLGHDRIAATAEELGIGRDLPAVPSLTLGSVGAPPLQVAAAYATIAADGVRHDPYLVERVETTDGEVLYEHEASPQEVLEPNVARTVTDVLRDVVESGTGVAAAIDHPVAGKTGTTNDHVDAWFVGYTPELTTAVWVGDLDNEPMDEVTGGTLPATIWGRYMGAYTDGQEPAEFPAPDTSGLRRYTDLATPA